MKYSNYVFVVLAVVSLTYGITQRSSATDLARELEAAKKRAEYAEAEAIRQQQLAGEQKKVAEKFAEESMNARLLAEQTLRDCEKKKR